MAKKVLLTGYLYAVIDTDVSEAMAIIGKLVPVETNGYGKELRAVEKEDDEISFQLINENQFIRITDETGQVEFANAKRLEAEKRRDEINNERWKLQDELKKVKAELETLKTVCPHTNEEEVITE